MTPARALNAEYDATPERYDALRDCWLNERRLGFLIERIARLAPPPGARVLEIGSGTGWLLSRLASRFPELRFTGIEPIEGYVAFARRASYAPNVEYAVGIGENLAASLAPGTRFAVLLTNDVLHHVSSEAATASSAASVAAEGALWIAIEPNWKNPYVSLGSARKPGERNFWPRAFLRAAEASGWRRAGGRHLFLIPPFVRRPPRFLRWIERALERVPLIAGGICVELRYGAK